MALRAFREEYVASSEIEIENFIDPEARKIRYDILWAQYENTVYRSIHAWAGTYKTRYALYRYIRNIYNPAYRLGEFWKAHTWGGPLDPEAGEEGALPIETTNKNIRPPIADIWQWSNWATRKDIVTLQGAIYGDTILKVIDDVEREKVYLENVYPGLVTDLTKDPFGHIKGYTIEEERAHPIHGRAVTYKETAERDGDNVVFATFLNDQPFAWNDIASSWSEPYGFVPMIHIQHNDVGLGFGWSELHPGRSKMHELDDLASLLSDQIRKTVNAKWLFTGVKATSPTQTMTTTETTARPEPGREEEPALYSPDPQSKAMPLVTPVDIEGVNLHIHAILEEFERDYPELSFEALRIQGDISGRALRIARQPAEAKVQQRRTNYDDGLKRALQMAVSIGGFRSIFPGFSLDSFEAGALDFEFAERGVFVTDPIDESEEDEAFWAAAKIAKEAGMPLLAYLELKGWSEEDLEKLANDPELQARQALMENMDAFGGGDDEE
ncbi:MAG: hypothetical protein KAJ73_01000 [Zetaproteobacteria bacterium]|nr:hypothetical protein [Zetaproteobacteria bacterium]